MNLPYSDSEPETEDEKTQETGQPFEEEKNQELLLSDVPSAETSTSKTNKINMLLQKLYHARHTEIANTLEEEIPVENHQEQARRSTRLKGSASKRS